MHSQALSAAVHRNARRAVFGAGYSNTKQQYLAHRARNRPIARAVDTQKPTPTELAPLPWTGSEQQQQVGPACVHSSRGGGGDHTKRHAHACLPARAPLLSNCSGSAAAQGAAIKGRR